MIDDIDKLKFDEYSLHKCMGKTKYTLSQVADYFSSQGCKLLEEKYISCIVKMAYVCFCGQESEISFDLFKRGRRCRKCGNAKISNRLKSDIEEIKEYFKKYNCELLAQDYKNRRSPMLFRCGCGKEEEITLAEFQGVKKCKSCRMIHNHNYDYIKSVFDNEGCVLLENAYKNNSTPMKYQCKCGNISTTRFANFQLGKRCRLCVSGVNHPRWIKDREKAKANYLFSSKCRNMLRRCLNKLGVKKVEKTEKALGYTRQELQEHIEKNHNWKIVKDSEWHIDHIYPIKAFLDHSITDVKIINCLENLEPIARHINQRKSSKYDKEQFLKWLQLKKELGDRYI